ncbi:NAD-dependent protein deacylase [Cyphellophora attinorum]|uniref:NAD-dependent protein deacylase n=1 Tax=Cyphellophora attinorum TaxID=1664694 RepID=A0A0N1P4E4_9EURO|nr:NAD-dependent protein deacylase [Phialophora attinorum]KPI45552.1 NAD-dependent protein deacylase [Phialophora attinorum]
MTPKAKDDMPSTDIAAFKAHLLNSRRIVALLGAGLSASSGLPTFRGAGGLWRNYDATVLATPTAFRNDPGLVWQFYSYRRHMALNAKPNPAHYALAELARRNPQFLTLSQNVDNLGPRAGHPEKQLKLLHGNLFDIKCWDERRCGYVRKNDLTDPIVEALAIPEDQAAIDVMLQKKDGVDPEKPAFGNKLLEKHIAQKGASIGTSGEETAAPELKEPGQIVNTKAAKTAERQSDVPSNPLIRGLDISNADIPISSPPTGALPHCPKCEKNLLRPGVVWFGESLPEDVMQSVNDYFAENDKIDLMLVIGTSAKVWPAAGYSAMAKKKGARVAVINMDRSDARALDSDDFFFEGDAAVLVPQLLEGVIGKPDTWRSAEDAKQ